MKHKRGIMVLIMTACLIVPTIRVHAENVNEAGFRERINSRVVVDELPEVEAWETDLNGVVTQVTPLHERNENTRVPSDGLYEFQGYNPDAVVKNWTYKVAGSFRVQNNSPDPASFTYTQVATTVTNASVTGNITAKADVKAAFVAKLEVALSISGTFAKTWTQGQTYGVSKSVPGKTTSILTNYAVGANSNGILTYKKYVSGTFAGYYTETCGGTIVSDTDINIVLD